MQRFGDRFHFQATAAELSSLADSIQHWQPFPDTIAALQTLKQTYQLTILSNIDDDLFAATARHLQVPFDWVITAEQVGSYKPSLRNFQFALQKMEIPAKQVLHVAASLYHDIAPANSLGLSTVWVNRRMGKAGPGAALPTVAQPNLTVPDLQTLAAMV